MFNNTKTLRKMFKETFGQSVDIDDSKSKDEESKCDTIPEQILGSDDAPAKPDFINSGHHHTSEIGIIEKPFSQHDTRPNNNPILPRLDNNPNEKKDVRNTRLDEDRAANLHSHPKKHPVDAKKTQPARCDTDTDDHRDELENINKLIAEIESLAPDKDFEKTNDSNKINNGMADDLNAERHQQEMQKTQKKKSATETKHEELSTYTGEHKGPKIRRNEGNVLGDVDKELERKDARKDGNKSHPEKLNILRGLLTDLVRTKRVMH